MVVAPRTSAGPPQAPRRSRRPLVLVHGRHDDDGARKHDRPLTAHDGSPTSREACAAMTWRHPFPEELNRKLATVLSRIHYAPGPWGSVEPARRRRRHGVRTRFGTASRSVPDEAPAFSVPERPFGVVSVHRFELLNNRRLLTETVDVLAEAAKRTPLLFIDHPVTAAAIERFRLADRFDGESFRARAASPLLRLRAPRAPKHVRRHRQRWQPGRVLLPRPAVPRAPREDGTP